MKAVNLYKQMERDFITPKMSDEWAIYMKDIADFMCDNFKDRSMGLVCDNADEITHVYSAVFPSKKVMQKIIDDDANNALLFVHHPSNWDVRQSPPFFQMDRTLLRQFRDRKISVYNLHVPLDANGPYSTSTTLAKSLGFVLEQSFASYHGVHCGVIGVSSIKTVQQLHEKFNHVVGHSTKLYHYGDNHIDRGRVAFLAGGGNELEYAKKAHEEGINVIVTGITIRNDYFQEVHNFEITHKINLLGGTHYSTEMFACKAMCDYFKKLDVTSEFIPNTPMMDDL